MKLIITTLLLFALGFFGTGLAIHPNSPIAVNKVLANFEKDKTSEEHSSEEIEEPVSEDNENVETVTSSPDTNQSKQLEDLNSPKETDGTSNVTTALTPARPIVTKRPADTSKPIALSPAFKQLTKKDIITFLDDKKPNIVIVVDLNNTANVDLIDSLNVLSEAFPMMLDNTYVINTGSTELEISRGAINIDSNFQVSTSPAIYYQRAALIHYHKSLRNIDYSDLYTFAARIYE